ncbi:MAG: fused MFS/spermidine synthase [Candidatus Coatesbacteria bacterium]
MIPATRGEPLLVGGTVFLAGAVVLVLEILGARLLAPFFGASQYVWSALIAVTMLALAAGYRGGGRLADVADPLPALFRLLVLAGWLVLLVVPARHAVLPACAARLGLRGGALCAALVLLAPSLTLLGAVAPLAARSAVAELGSLGVTVGSLYALSTVGSLAGALAAGFVLVPALGVVKILLLAALALFAPAAWYWWAVGRPGDRGLWRVLLVAGAAAAVIGLLRPAPTFPAANKADGWSLLFREDSRYGQVEVVEYRGRRLLIVDGTLQTGVDLATGSPLFPYAVAMPALLAAAAPDARRVCLVGFGGGVVAGALAARGLAVESVEIDPAVEGAARRFFVGGAKLPVVEADGRTFLRETPPGRYDAVLLDAYTGEAPPAHLFTAECYRLVRRALAPGGVGVANLIAYPDGVDGRLARCVDTTLRAVFPWVTAFRVEAEPGVTNVLYVFGESPRRLKRLRFPGAHPQIAAMVAGLLDRRLDLAGPDAFVLTDDYCPLDRLALPAREVVRRNMRGLFPAWLLLG